TIKILDEDGSAVPQTISSLPKLKRSMLPAPSGTLILTELMEYQNTIASINSVRIWGADEQESIFKHAPAFHSGRFNYLMADGHTERLTAFQSGGTGGKDSPGGIWTIRQGD
ncbi:MAG TPA: H-X9-DG-CTERM domain-containing protein, partial [Verrucomicrobiae bacterium]|nr:H-X9-DG-CTERM domain-containing protein [Verrucomicrobiae bacterium]